MLNNIKIKENSWVARIAAKKLKSDSVAFTFGKKIFLFNVTKDQFLANDKWVKHELQHVAQFKKYGIISFAFMYLWESIRHGYQNNKWEKEAREYENL